MSTINGKKPLSQKRTAPPTVNQAPEFFKNKLALSNELRAELDTKGMDYRWISYNKWMSEGQGHERGWQVYKRDKKDTPESFVFGANPDGIIRVSDCVLAVRPKEWSTKHQDWLKEKVRRASGKQKADAEQMRQRARESGVVNRVTEGYDEDEDT